MGPCELPVIDGAREQCGSLGTRRRASAGTAQAGPWRLLAPVVNVSTVTREPCSVSAVSTRVSDGVLGRCGSSGARQRAGAGTARAGPCELSVTDTGADTAVGEPCSVPSVSARTHLERVEQMRQHSTSAAEHTQAVRPTRFEVERLALAAACSPSAVPITVAAGQLAEGRAWYDGRLGGRNLLQTFRGRPACCVVKAALGCGRV